MDAKLLEIGNRHLRKILEYDPYHSFPNVKTRSDFIKLLNKDPAFSTLGLCNEKYVIARIGGNLITSIHRKIGDMYEEMFQHLIAERFSLSESEIQYHVKVRIENREQARSTDGMIPIAKLRRSYLPQLNASWQQSTGLGFEIRSCYQIGDSKRIQADWDMALALKAQGITPIMLILCETSLRSPVSRLSTSWNLFEGKGAFQFIRELTGYDLFDFMTRHSDPLGAIITKVLANL
jgi:hypothetical protein